MPLPVAPLVGWLLGLWLAWSARDERRPRGDRGPAADELRLLLFSRPVVVALALAAFVYAPIVGYFAMFHGDWTYLYLLNWRRVPSALDLVLVLVASSTIPIATMVGLGPSRAGRSAVLLRLAAGPAAAAIVLVAVFARRMTASASYAQFHGHFGVEAITDATLGRGVLLSAIALGAAVAWSVRALRG